MAERDVSFGRDPEEAEARAAGICLADAFMDLFERVFHVREAMMPVFGNVIGEFAREAAKLIEHSIESLLADCVLLLRRGRHRREADFPEPDLLGEMLVDARDVERIGRERDAGPD